jgi:hypothetical protein
MDVPVDTKRARDSPVELRFLRQQAIAPSQQLINPKVARDRAPHPAQPLASFGEAPPIHPHRQNAVE